MRHTLLPVVFIFLVSSVAVLSAHANEYYFDSKMGSDENLGTSDEIPFQSLDKLKQLSLKPGDIVRFKRGCTFRGQLSFQGNGTEGQPILLTTYGKGFKPEILGSVQLTKWEHYRGEVYRVKVAEKEFVGDHAVYSVFDYPPGGVPKRLAGSWRNKNIPTIRGSFYYDKESRYLFVITSDGKPPSKHHLEASVVTPLVRFSERSWIEIENLTFLFGNRMHLTFKECHDITLRDCASLFVGSFGNPNIVISHNSHHISVLGCFLYENVNCGILITDGATRCEVKGCTIVKGLSNDGVTCHSGPKGKDGLPTHRTGDYNVIEGNVIGLFPEESIDITSGDYQIIRGNICYENRNPGIIVGHGSDHNLIQNNICFGNRRAGIHISGNEKEGARGENHVVQNLVYNNGYPGLEIQAKNTKVFNNTVVDSLHRPAVRISAKGHGSELYNNLIATLDTNIPYPSLHFLRGTPITFDTKLSHNIFFHRADQRKPDILFPAGCLIRTSDGSFTLADFLARYGTGGASFVAVPKFAGIASRYYFLAPDSPCIDAGIDVGLPFAGKAPDVGWKELGSEGKAPRYPTVFIKGGNDDENAILYLWGKRKVSGRGPKLLPESNR